MKLITVIMLTTMLHVSASSLAQKLTLTQKNVTLSQVFREIRVQTGYSVLWKTDELNSSAKINADFKNTPLEEVMARCLKEQSVTYVIEDMSIIIVKKESPAVLEKVISVFAKEDIKGRVTDSDGHPLPGAGVKVKGDTKGVSTDLEGYFLLKNVDKNTMLEISYVGFQVRQIEAKQGMVVALTPEVNRLAETVVVGYGVQAKALVSASVSQISGEELKKNQAVNLTQKLAGALPGVMAVNSSGQPGKDNTNFTIRGLSTTSDNTPLLVVDGIVRPSFAFMDPNDIESISVLKDAAATAVYGARAANGAIHITTKRGTVGTTSINYSSNFGFQKAAQIQESIDSYRTASLWNEAWKNEGAFAPDYYGTRGFNDAALAAIQSGSDPNRYANTDWYKLLYGRNAPQQSHSISVNGGTEKNRFFVSGGYLSQGGFWTASNFKRYNIRTNLDGNIGNIFDFSLNIAARREDVKDINPGISPKNSAYGKSPIYPNQYLDGSYSFDAFEQGNTYLGGQGAAGYNNITRDIFESSATISYKVPFVEGLSLKGLYSFDKDAGFGKNFNKPYITYQLNDDNSLTVPASVTMATADLSETFSKAERITSEFSINYNRIFSSHSVNAFILYSETSNSSEQLGAGRINFPSAALDQLNLGATVGQTNKSSASQSGRRSVVSRIAYNYKQKYLLEFNSRYDGSDQFPPGQRYGFFPAISAGWRISEEPFIKDNLSFINSLKIRGSWGKAGNDRGGQFQYLSTFSISTEASHGFGGVSEQILTPGVIPNPNFTWEKSTSTNIGFDASLWNNLLGLNADYFFKRTSDILSSPVSAVPDLLGGTLPIGNYGIVDNQGFEIELSHFNKVAQVSYYIKPNVTYNKSRVIYYPEAQSTPEATKKTGKSVQLGSIAGYRANGLYQSQQEINSGPKPLSASTKPGDIRYVDENGDGMITASDMILISPGPMPRFIFGLNAGGEYKGFDLNMFFQGAAGVKTVLPLPLTQSMFARIPLVTPNQLDYWTPENPDATFPRLTVTSLNNTHNSTYWVRNSSYLRMKSLEIGYKIPESVLSKIKVSNIRLFISGTNLFTISPLKGLIDPETSIFNTPLVKVYSMGINVKFN